MDVVRAIDNFEYYRSRTGINKRSVWLLWRQQAAMSWRMVISPRITYKPSVCAPEWINGHQ